MTKILVALREEERPYMEQALGDEHGIVWCSNWSELQDALLADIDAVLCSVHFDDGRLFDVVEQVKSSGAHRDVPVYGIVIESRQFSRHFIAGLRSAVSVLDGEGVLDLAGLRRDCGEVEAVRMLRTAMDGIVLEGLRRRRRHLRPVPSMPKAMRAAKAPSEMLLAS